ncbi:MAG: flagellar hook-length control protein FliK [Gammaproteobacteria bacterium]|nr:flagellar hook-length control protein FliK [Gammaproteobacteria bacterium]
MEIKPPANNLYVAASQPLTAVAANNLPKAPVNWEVSQLIKAVITQITAEEIFLDIQGIKANTPKPNIAGLQIGDILKLQVEQLKPMPQFRILSIEKTENTNIVSQALKNPVFQTALPLPPLLKNISFVATRPALHPAPLSADVNAAIRDIYKNMPAQFNLKTASQVKMHLQNSGLFIESKIRNQIINTMQSVQFSHTSHLKTRIDSHLKTELSHDLGAQLHRLASLIKIQLSAASIPASIANPAKTNPVPQTAVTQPNMNNTAQLQSNRPAEQASLQNISLREEAMQTLLRQVETSLTHLQQTQLQNMNESQAGRPLWLMELPVKNGQDIDLFQLRISQDEENRTEGEATKIWNVTLQFDLEGLGKIKSHIKMQNNIISAQFFSEKPETLNLFRKNFDYLRNRLSYNGLNVGNIDCAQKNLLMTEVTPIDKLDEQT